MHLYSAALRKLATYVLRYDDVPVLLLDPAAASAEYCLAEILSAILAAAAIPTSTCSSELAETSRVGPPLITVITISCCESNSLPPHEWKVEEDEEEDG